MCLAKQNVVCFPFLYVCVFCSMNGNYCKYCMQIDLKALFLFVANGNKLLYENEHSF